MIVKNWSMGWMEGPRNTSAWQRHISSTIGIVTLLVRMLGVFLHAAAHAIGRLVGVSCYWLPPLTTLNCVKLHLTLESGRWLFRHILL